MNSEEIKSKVVRPTLQVAIPVIAVVLLFVFRARVGPIFVPFLLAFVIAYILDPLVTKLDHSNKLSRTAGTALVYAIALLVVATFVLIIVPLLISEIIDLVTSTPDYVRVIGDFLSTKFGQVWNSFSPDFREAVESFFSEENILQMWQEEVLPYLKNKGYGEGAQAVAEGIKGASSAIAGVLFFTVTTIFGGITGIIGFFITFSMALVIAFYLLKDMPGLKKKVMEYIPDKYDEKVLSLAGELDRLISGFLRGQLLVCLSIGILTGIGMFIIGIDKALLIALLAGTFNFVPYLGPVMGAMPAIIFAFVEYFPDGGWTSFLIRAGAVVVWFSLVQTLDGMLISPKIMSKNISLHPLFIVFALLAGGHLFGFVGMLLAVPVAAILKILVREVYLALYKPKGEENAST